MSAATQSEKNSASVQDAQQQASSPETLQTSVFAQSTSVAPAQSAQAEAVLSKEELKLRKKLERQKKRAGKKRFPIKRTIFGVIVLVLAVWIGFGMWMTKNMPTFVETTAVEKGDLSEQVTLSGTLMSAETRQVYSEMTGVLATVDAEIGDWVEEGQVLATLDTEELERSIEKQRASMGIAGARSALSIKQSQERMENAKQDLDEGLNQTLNDAEYAVERAMKALFTAQDNFYSARTDMEYGESMLVDARQRKITAQDDVKVAQIELERYENAHPEDTTSEAYLEKKRNLAEKERSLLAVQQEVDKLNKSFSAPLSAESLALENARADYERALDAQRVAEQNVKRSMTSMEQEIQSAKLGADNTLAQMELRDLEKKLEQSVVKAPVSGMITAVLAKEGNASAGVLFVIEDTRNLIMNTTIKEINIGEVKEGMKADIKSDSMKDKTFGGKVKRIFPTAVKSLDGMTQSSNNAASFETEIALDNSEDSLRVGMSVRATLVTKERKDVLYVPFDAVKTDADGQNFVYTTEMGEKGLSTVKAIPVTTGMETDFYVEVSGEGLSEGMQIIANPADVEDGMSVMVMPEGVPVPAVSGAASAAGTVG